MAFQEADMSLSDFRDPFEALLAMQRALDSRFANDWMGSRTAGRGSYPPINVFQRGDDLVAVIELPGMDKADIAIETKENTIRISGRKTIRYDQAASVHRRERASGVFDRTLSVPIQIEPDGIRAEYRDGMLAVFIPRAEREKPRTIKITG
jgi:HSP20 family protein